MRVLPADFRLWVCLHEVTHRVQFRANPWLADHMSRSLAVITEEAGDDVAQVVGRLAEFVRSRRDYVIDAASEPNSSGMIGLLRAVQAEPQRRALDQLLVLGTLLEGHADHVMDAVGPKAAPSVATIRRRFDERRQRKQPPLQRVMRALLGFDAKLSQYTGGKAFVDYVVLRVGMKRFNAVWSSPESSRSQRKSTSHSGASTGRCSRAGGGRQGVLSRARGRRPALVRRAVGRGGFAGADGRRGSVEADNGADGRPSLCSTTPTRWRRRRATRRSRWDVSRLRCFASTWALREAPRPRPVPHGTRHWTPREATHRCCLSTAGRSGRDRAAGAGPRLGGTFHRRYAPARPAVVPPAAGGPSCGDTCGVHRTETHTVAGPPQQRSSLHQDPAAHRGASAVGGGSRGWRRGGPCPYRDGASGGHRDARRPGSRRTHRGDDPARPRHRPPDNPSGGRSAQGDSGLAPGGRRQRVDRQADPRGGHPGHRVARTGRCRRGSRCATGG